MNAFHWRENKRPSIFATDPAFTGTRSGKTMSQVSSAVVDQITKRTGRNPGSIMGISSQGDRLVDEANRRRKAKA